MPDVEIEILGRTHQKIGFGNHKGNRFTIVARGCCHPDGSPMTNSEAMDKIAHIEALMKEELGRDYSQIGLVHKDLVQVDRLPQSLDVT